MWWGTVLYLCPYSSVCCVFFFFFKQKTAYEIVSRDWSSDVCSSDLTQGRGNDSSNRGVKTGTEGEQLTMVVVYKIQGVYLCEGVKFL